MSDETIDETQTDPTSPPVDVAGARERYQGVVERGYYETTTLRGH